MSAITLLLRVGMEETTMRTTVSHGAAVVVMDTAAAQVATGTAVLLVTAEVEVWLHYMMILGAT